MYVITIPVGHRLTARQLGSTVNNRLGILGTQILAQAEAVISISPGGGQARSGGRAVRWTVGRAGRVNIIILKYYNRIIL